VYKRQEEEHPKNRAILRIKEQVAIMVFMITQINFLIRANWFALGSFSFEFV